jgi:hypothetical protein
MVMLLADAFACRGARVDVLDCAAEGELGLAVPEGVTIAPLSRRDPLAARIAALGADPAATGVLLCPLLSPKHGSRTLDHLPTLAACLRARRPGTLFAAIPDLDIEAVLARRLAERGHPARAQRAQSFLQRPAPRRSPATPRFCSDRAGAAGARPPAPRA